MWLQTFPPTNKKGTLGYLWWVYLGGFQLFTTHRTQRRYNYFEIDFRNLHLVFIPLLSPINLVKVEPIQRYYLFIYQIYLHKLKNSVSLSNTWQHHFQTLVTSKDANKNLKVFARYSSFINQTNFHKDVLHKFNQDKDSIVLARAPANNKLAIYYIINHIDGTRARPDDKLVDLLGSSPESTTVVFDKFSVLLLFTCPMIQPLSTNSLKYSTIL